jgi:acyl dehydratase
MVDTKFIGKKYGPTTYEVGKEKIKEYALAVGDLNPLYLDDAAAAASPYGGIVAPPLFCVVFSKQILEMLLLDKELKLNLMMLVHGGQEFEFGVPVRPGDVITTEGVLADITQKGKLDFVTQETVSKNQKGEVTNIGRWTFAIRN